MKNPNLYWVILIFFSIITGCGGKSDSSKSTSTTCDKNYGIDQLIAKSKVKAKATPGLYQLSTIDFNWKINKEKVVAQGVFENNNAGKTTDQFRFSCPSEGKLIKSIGNTIQGWTELFPEEVFVDNNGVSKVEDIFPYIETEFIIDKKQMELLKTKRGNANAKDIGLKSNKLSEYEGVTIYPLASELIVVSKGNFFNSEFAITYKKVETQEDQTIPPRKKDSTKKPPKEKVPGFSNQQCIEQVGLNLVGLSDQSINFNKDCSKLSIMGGYDYDFEIESIVFPLGYPINMQCGGYKVAKIKMIISNSPMRIYHKLVGANPQIKDNPNIYIDISHSLNEIISYRKEIEDDSAIIPGLEASYAPAGYGHTLISGSLSAIFTLKEKSVCEIYKDLDNYKSSKDSYDRVINFIKNRFEIEF